MENISIAAAVVFFAMVEAAGDLPEGCASLGGLGAGGEGVGHVPHGGRELPCPGEEGFVVVSHRGDWGVRG